MFDGFLLKNIVYTAFFLAQIFSSDKGSSAPESSLPATSVTEKKAYTIACVRLLF